MPVLQFTNMKHYMNQNARQSVKYYYCIDMMLYITIDHKNILILYIIVSAILFVNVFFYYLPPLTC